MAERQITEARIASDPYDVVVKTRADPPESEARSVDKSNQDAGEETVKTWTSQQCADAVCTLGAAFEQYREIFIDNGVSGQVFVELSNDDLMELGIAKNVHRKSILQLASSLMGQSRSSPPPSPKHAAPHFKSTRQLFSYPSEDSLLLEEIDQYIGTAIENHLSSPRMASISQPFSPVMAPTKSNSFSSTEYTRPSPVLTRRPLHMTRSGTDPIHSVPLYRSPAFPASVAMSTTATATQPVSASPTPQMLSSNTLFAFDRQRLSEREIKASYAAAMARRPETRASDSPNWRERREAETSISSGLQVLELNDIPRPSDVPGDASWPSSPTPLVRSSSMRSNPASKSSLNTMCWPASPQASEVSTVNIGSPTISLPRSSSGLSSTSVSHSITLASRFRGHVLGHKGASLNNICSTSDCKIKIERNVMKSDSDGGMLDRYLIEGPPSGIQTAVQLLTAMVSDWEEERFDVPEHLLPAVVGPNKSYLERVSAVTGAKLFYVHNDTSPCPFLEIRGDPKHVAHARHLLQAEAAKWEDSLAAFEFDKDEYTNLESIMPRFILRLQAINGVVSAVLVPSRRTDPDIHELVVCGSKEGLEAASKEVSSFCQDPFGQIPSTPPLSSPRKEDQTAAQPVSTMTASDVATPNVLMRSVSAMTSPVCVRPSLVKSQSFSMGQEMVEAGETTMRYPLVRKLIGRVMGRRGANFQTIRDSTHVTLHVDDDNDVQLAQLGLGSELQRKTTPDDVVDVIITGKPPSVNTAIAMLDDIVHREMNRRERHIDLPVKVISALSDRNGELRRRIERDTNARIMFPGVTDRASQPDAMIHVVFVGVEEAVQNCEARLKQLAATIMQPIQ